MTSGLIIRLSRLEKHNSRGNQYAHLSDDELNARIDRLTADVEVRVGVKAGVYADSLFAALECGDTLPEGWSHTETENYAQQLRRVADGRQSNEQA